jgi:hypothetical protein
MAIWLLQVNTGGSIASLARPRVVRLKASKAGRVTCMLDRRMLVSPTPLVELEESMFMLGRRIEWPYIRRR